MAKREKNKQLVKLKNVSEYLVLRMIAALVRSLPRTRALRLGALLGRAAMFFIPERANLARENLRNAFPALTETEIEQLLRENFAHFGISSVEMLRLDMFRPAEVERYFDISGMEHLEQAFALGRGVLLMTAHLGFWEAGCFVLPVKGFACDMVAKPMRNPLVDQYFLKMRTSFGASIIESVKGGRRILKALKAGRGVAVLLDQHAPRKGGVMTQFFGRDARTTTILTSMAMKHGVPVVPMFSLRQPDFSYKIWAEPMLLLEGEGEEAVARNTQLLTAVTEAAVRKGISQWFWMHKRWRANKNKRISEGSIQ